MANIEALNFAKQIVAHLDSQEVKKGDGYLDKPIWSQFIADKGGKDINNSISYQNAERSIAKYLTEQANKLHTTASKLAAEWLKFRFVPKTVSANTTSKETPENAAPVRNEKELTKVYELQAEKFTPAKAFQIKNSEDISESDMSLHQRAEAIAEAWAEPYHVSNKNGEFTKFVEKLYKLAKKLNITKTNGGSWDKSKYPTIEDQIVDELMAIFAGESSFDPRSKNGKYRGIFQLDQMSLNALKMSNKVGRISAFANLSRIQQLEYFAAHIELGKTYSQLGDKALSPAEAWRLVQYPAYGKPEKLKSKSQQKAAADTLVSKKRAITKIQQRRNEIEFSETQDEKNRT